jgi:hypothetical protein
LHPQNQSYVVALWRHHSTTARILGGYRAARNVDIHGNSSNVCGALQLAITEIPKGVNATAIHHVELDLVSFATAQPAAVLERKSLLLASYSFLPNLASVFDLPSIPQSPFEVACKMTSKFAYPTESTLRLCADANKRIFMTSMQFLTPFQLQRFSGLDWKVEFTNDSAASSGPTWLASPLLFEANFQLRQLRVQAPALITTANSWIYPSSHYCKLLSLRTFQLSSRFVSAMADAGFRESRRMGRW